MAKHHADLVMCMKQPGIAIGRLCERCDGKCPVCDSHVRPHTLVRICDECSFGALEGRCIVCGAPGVADAYYCRECTGTRYTSGTIKRPCPAAVLFVVFLCMWLDGVLLRHAVSRIVRWPAKKTRLQRAQHATPPKGVLWRAARPRHQRPANC